MYEIKGIYRLSIFVSQHSQLTKIALEKNDQFSIHVVDLLLA